MRISVSLVFLITSTLARVPPLEPAQVSLIPRLVREVARLVREAEAERLETIPNVAEVGEDAIRARAAEFVNETAAEEASNLGPGVERDIYDRCYEELYRKLAEVYTPINEEQEYSEEALFHPATLMRTELRRLVYWMNGLMRNEETLDDEAAQEYINSRVISHRNILSVHDT